MNWRFLISLGVALLLRLVVRSHWKWTYQPFRDSFDLLLFGRDVVLVMILLTIVLALVNAVLGPPKED